MWLHALRRIASTSLDLLAPGRCAVCATPLRIDEAAACARCREQLAPPVLDLDLGGLQDVLAAAPLDGLVRAAVHDLKYHRQVWRAPGMGRLIGELVRTDLPGRIDVVMPVPSTPRRLAERGFNPAALLATEVARGCGVRLATQTVVRRIDRDHQVGRTRRERAEVVGDYGLRRGAVVAGLHVLLVDDVVTTGATLRACASVLLDRGAAGVSAATLAATPPRGAS